MTIPMKAAYCDFPYCAQSCWRRCDTPNGGGDGQPRNHWRDSWKATAKRADLWKNVGQQTLPLE